MAAGTGEFAKRPVRLGESDERLSELARMGSHEAFEAIGRSRRSPPAPGAGVARH